MGGEEGVSLQRIKAVSRMSETTKVNPTCHDLLKTDSQSQEFLTSLVEEMELRQQGFPRFEPGVLRKQKGESAGCSRGRSEAWDQGPGSPHPEVEGRWAE